MDYRILRVIAVIESDFQNCKLDSGGLASLVNLSQGRLQHLFKDETGRTLTQYIVSRRIREATNLLITDFLDVKQIMHRVGFRSYSHFIHTFKRVHGLPPRQFRTHRRA